LIFHPPGIASVCRQRTIQVKAAQCSYFHNRGQCMVARVACSTDFPSAAFACSLLRDPGSWFLTPGCSLCALLAVVYFTQAAARRRRAAGRSGPPVALFGGPKQISVVVVIVAHWLVELLVPLCIWLARKWLLHPAAAYLCTL